MTYEEAEAELRQWYREYQATGGTLTYEQWVQIGRPPTLADEPKMVNALYNLYLHPIFGAPPSDPLTFEQWYGQVLFPTAPVPEPVTLKFMDTIFSYVWDISDFFLGAFNSVKGWIFPFHYLSYPFYALHRAFWNLLTPIAHFGDWVNDIQSKIGITLSYANIYSYFKSWFDIAEIAYNWVNRWQDTILKFINTWWQTKLLELTTWWNSELAELREVKVKWDYFWTVLYPKSVNWDEFLGWWNTEIRELQSLINSSIRELEPLWAGWQEWRGKVTEFFTDPEDWLYKAADRIIERFW